MIISRQNKNLKLKDPRRVVCYIDENKRGFVPLFSAQSVQYWIFKNTIGFEPPVASGTRTQITVCGDSNAESYRPENK